MAKANDYEIRRAEPAFGERSSDDVLKNYKNFKNRQSKSQRHSVEVIWLRPGLVLDLKKIKIKFK